MFSSAKLIYHPEATRIPVFRKSFILDHECFRPQITVSALGVFQVYLNGEKVGDDVLSPGWEAYEKRIGAVRYDDYDGFDPIPGENLLEIVVTPGWYSGAINLGGCAPEYPLAVIAEIELDGKKIVTNSTWEVADSQILRSDIYHGIAADARLKADFRPAKLLNDFDKSLFVPIYENGQGAPVVEYDTVFPSEKIIVTPKGEQVLDFGQNLVGYPVLDLDAKKGDRVRLSFAEVLDRDGNFYNENYRAAKCEYDYIARRGRQIFTPIGTFYGFRYLRIDEFTGGYKHGAITARVIHTRMHRTGEIKTGHPLVNRLFENVIRGQIGNYVDIPTDCPQRDERLGWTGDAEVFIKAAAYNFDVLDFFRKWLTDCILEQAEDGNLPHFIPAPVRRFPDIPKRTPAAAWSDFITIIPYELYLMYGDEEILRTAFPAMQNYLACVQKHTTEKDLWCGKEHQYGDWLGLDAAEGSYDGASDKEICASAYYLHSVDLTARVAKILHRDAEELEADFARGRAKFIEKFEARLKTQTELLLALSFGLTDDVEGLGERLIEKIHADGDRISTGFMGTGHILHVLTGLGESKLAYDLLLRTDFPSWLYPITKGATTIWEHWDGIKPDGSFWSKDMNSYNHSAYGSVADWLYSVAGGIRPDPEFPGFEHALIAPIPDPRLGNFEASFETYDGKIVSSWYYEGDVPHYRITTPVPASIFIGESYYEVEPGEYVF